MYANAYSCSSGFQRQNTDPNYSATFLEWESEQMECIGKNSIAFTYSTLQPTPKHRPRILTIQIIHIHNETQREHDVRNGHEVPKVAKVLQTVVLANLREVDAEQAKLRRQNPRVRLQRGAHRKAQRGVARRREQRQQRIQVHVGGLADDWADDTVGQVEKHLVCCFTGVKQADGQQDVQVRRAQAEPRHRQQNVDDFPLSAESLVERVAGDAKYRRKNGPPRVVLQVCEARCVFPALFAQCVRVVTCRHVKGLDAVNVDIAKDEE